MTKNERKYSYYVSFINTVMTTNYNNLGNFERFANDSSVQSVNMYEIINFIRSEYIDEVKKHNGYGVMYTEMGFCYATSYVQWYGKVSGNYGSFVLAKYKNERRYGHLDEFGVTLAPFTMNQTQNMTIASAPIFKKKFK